MHKSNNGVPVFLEKLKSGLIRGLKLAGISAKVDSEPVPTTKLHRIYVLAPKFKSLWHTERQDLVWRIADKALTQDEQLRVSMIVTLTPAEMQGK